MRPWVSTWYHYRQLDLTWSWPNVWPQAPGNCDDAMLATSLQAWKKHQPPFAMSGWWLNQPNSKICSSKWVHLPQFSGWTLKKNWNHNLDAIRFTEPFLGARSMIWVGFVPVPWRDSSKDIYIYIITVKTYHKLKLSLREIIGRNPPKFRDTQTIPWTFPTRQSEKMCHPKFTFIAFINTPPKFNKDPKKWWLKNYLPFKFYMMVNSQGRTVKLPGITPSKKLTTGT